MRGPLALVTTLLMVAVVAPLDYSDAVCYLGLGDVDEDTCCGDARQRPMCAGTEVKTQNDGPVGAIDRAGVADECFANGDRDSSSTNFGYISIPTNASFLAPPVSYTAWAYPKADGSGNYGLIGVTGSSGQDGIKLGCLGGTDAFRARLRTNDGATIYDLETDVDSGNLMECVADDWYFVALVLDEDTVGGLIVSQTYTLRVTRYDVEADGTLGSMVYEYYDQTTALAGEEVSAGDDGDGLLIGSFANLWSGQKHWWGRIDDFAVWDRALTYDEYTSLRDLYGVPTPAPTLPPTSPMPTLCQDEWAELVGIEERSMSFPAAQWDDLFTTAELATLTAHWTLGEAWTLMMRATSTCDVDLLFGMAGAGGFLVVTVPADARDELLSVTDTVGSTDDVRFEVRSSEASTVSACAVAFTDIFACTGAPTTSPTLTLAPSATPTTAAPSYPWEQTNLLNFSSLAVRSWAWAGGSQNADDELSFFARGTGLATSGNTWLAFELASAYVVDDASYLRFDFSQLVSCEIHAIALLADGYSAGASGQAFSTYHIWQLSGSQVWGDADSSFAYSATPGATQTFTISLAGSEGTSVTDIGIANDCDTGATNDAAYARVALYSLAPTASPTVSAVPSALPIPAPTALPIPAPSALPTTPPSPAPTALPIPAPSALPIPAPTPLPSPNPTPPPSPLPTISPLPTQVPTSLPTSRPTSAPTSAPTSMPTALPSSMPTAMPTARPTAAPTAVPTALPSSNPTPLPTISPIPTPLPTALPTSSPSSTPTASPTSVPTASPTAMPTTTPTATPTTIPSAAPTPVPTSLPTPLPTAAPTSAPTPAPSPSPTPMPTTPGPTSSPTQALSREARQWMIIIGTSIGATVITVFIYKNHVSISLARVSRARARADALACRRSPSPTG